MVHIYVPMAHSKVVYSSKVLCLTFGMDDACYSTAARPPRHRLDAKNFAKIFRFPVTSNL
jgi:hypothetical protein